MRLLFILFVVMPIVEMFVLIKVGGVIGAPLTIGLVVLTAMAGMALLRQQGMSTLMSARNKLDGGQLPMNEIVSGVFLAVGGALLLTPGFITDALGFACLIPGLRNWIIAHLIVMLRPNVVVYGQATTTASMDEKHVIQGEYRREEEP